MSRPWRGLVLYTVGHSNRTAGELGALLGETGLGRLLDVRRYPGSRRHPQFRLAALEAGLAERGLRYRHEPELGGHRSPRLDSPHRALREPAFRGYADHMATEAFRAAVLRLADEARAERTAVMCAEADPARCHRGLLADHVVAEGGRVVHVLGPGRVAEHELSDLLSAREPGALVYAAPPSGQLELFD